MTEALTNAIHETAGIQSLPEKSIQNNDQHWAVAVLRYGLGVYIRKDDESPVARQLLEQTARSVYGDDCWKRALGKLESEAQNTETVPDERLEGIDGDDREKALVAATLVYLAVVDQDWTKAQQDYLSHVIPQLIAIDAAELLNWMHGTWPRDRYRFLDQPLEFWTTGTRKLARKHAASILGFAKQNRRVDVTPEEFRDQWETVRSHLRGLKPLSQQLGPAFVSEVERSIRALQQMKQIRVVVLGEFNVGKSTLVNRLLGLPGFMPTDGLPSTSGIIEVRSGEQERYLCKNAAGEEYEEVRKQAFSQQAGNANELSLASATGGDTDNRSVRQWKVYVPETVLTGEQEVALVDTPGLNEDPLRDELSKREARTAHAAVLVMDAGQPLTQYEQELLEVMAGQIRGLTVVLNKVDTVAQDVARGAKTRVLEHLERYGLREDQIVLFNAEDPGVGGGVGEKELTERIRAVAVENVTPVRYGQLANEVDRLGRALRQQLDHYEKKVQQTVEELQEERERRDAKRQQCRAKIQSVEEVVRQAGQDAARHLSFKLEKDWPEIVEKLKQSKSNWSTEKNPLWSPKKAAKDIAEDAESNLVGLVKSWAHEQGEPVFRDRIESMMKQIRDDLEEIADYVEEAQGMDADDVVSHLIERASGDAFDEPDLDFDLKDGFQAALMVVVSAAVGYIVADVVLYYMLSLIAGLLNPWLIAAAATAALTILVTSGKVAMYRKVKDKVADKIEEELTSEAVKNELRDGVQEKVEETFDSFGRSIRKQANSYVEEAEHQFEKVVQDLENTRDEKEEIQNRIRDLRGKVNEFDRMADGVQVDVQPE
jgi:GTP-binding protein EngB required for normal cell division